LFLWPLDMSWEQCTCTEWLSVNYTDQTIFSVMEIPWQSAGCVFGSVIVPEYRCLPNKTVVTQIWQIFTWLMECTLCGTLSNTPVVRTELQTLDFNSKGFFFYAVHYRICRDWPTNALSCILLYLHDGCYMFRQDSAILREQLGSFLVTSTSIGRR
jgi:hypothetical protein